MEYVEKMELELESEHFPLYEKNRRTHAEYVKKMRTHTVEWTIN